MGETDGPTDAERDKDSGSSDGPVGQADKIRDQTRTICQHDYTS